MTNRTRRGAATVVGALMLGACAFASFGCDDPDRGEEALEEIKDEAHDAKENLEDELDDRT